MRVLVCLVVPWRDRARAEVVHPSQSEPSTVLVAVLENGRWFLKHALGCR